MDRVGARLRLISHLAKLELCRRSFYFYCRYIDPEFFTDNKQHLILIANALQMLYEGRILKLLISLPPRSGKSYITSLFISWYLGKEPSRSFMRNSYAESLAFKFSYDVREIIQRDKYREIFPEIELRQDKYQVADWAITLSKQSSYFCAGVGGAITGKGCDGIAVLDDPIKNLEEGWNETYLEKVFNWYNSTHKSRMEKGCKEIHIATRWNQKDPIGVIESSEKVEDFVPDQQEYDSSVWYRIVVPALNERGESFCDEVKTTSEYLHLRDTMDSLIWEAVWMQNPISSKGLLFPRNELNWFTMDEIEKYEDKKYPEKWDAVIGYTDTADEGTDYLASAIAKISGEKVYITDVVYTQESIELTIPKVANMIMECFCNRMEVESNFGGKSYAKDVKREIVGKSKCTITWRPNSQNKETRILMRAGQIKKYFYFRSDYKHGSDYGKFIEGLTSYLKLGSNKHDDAPDCLTGLASMIYDKKEIKAIRKP